MCDDKVAPHAATADETGEFPWSSYDALRASDFHAPHIPSEYGGAGADALATAIVIEEVARACASSSLIPAVNKLGTMPLLLAGSDEIKERYLPPVARGEAMFSYCLSEPEAGSDAASMRTRAVRDGDDCVLNGAKRWITNAGVSDFYTVLAVTDPGAGPAASPPSSWSATTPAFPSARRRRSSASRARRRGRSSSTAYGSARDRMIGAEGTGFRTAMRTLDHTRVTIAAQAVGIAQGALDFALSYVQERQQFGKRDRRVPGRSSSCSPTWA